MSWYADNLPKVGNNSSQLQGGKLSDSGTTLSPTTVLRVTSCHHQVKYPLVLPGYPGTRVPCHTINVVHPDSRYVAFPNLNFGTGCPAASLSGGPGGVLTRYPSH
eukprot:3939566-Rhodomonas_salina.1